jgi:HD superfamily phosphodiesterase
MDIKQVSDQITSYKDKVLKMRVPYELYTFASKALEGFDESNDDEHSYAVWQNAYKLMDFAECYNGELTKKEKKIIMFSCYLHNTIDNHAANITEEELYKFIESHLGPDDADTCIHIIKNISWTKRETNIPLLSRDILRQIVQCADWMESLGDEGIRRCRIFTHERGGTEEDAVKYAREKLQYIRDDMPLPYARCLVKHEHKKIMKWIEQYDKNLK